MHFLLENSYWTLLYCSATKPKIAAYYIFTTSLENVPCINAQRQYKPHTFTFYMAKVVNFPLTNEYT